MAKSRQSPTEEQIWEWTLKEFGLEPEDADLVQKEGTSAGVLPKNIITLLSDKRASHDYLRLAIIGYIADGTLKNRNPDNHTIVKNFKKHYRIWERIQKDFKLEQQRQLPKDENYWLGVVRDSKGRIVSHGKKRTIFE